MECLKCDGHSESIAPTCNARNKMSKVSVRGRQTKFRQRRQRHLAAAIIIPEIYHKRIMCSTVIKDC